MDADARDASPVTSEVAPQRHSPVYSRKFEAEADEATIRYLLSKGWSTQPLQDILLRMTKAMPEFAGRAAFSSHPDTADGWNAWRPWRRTMLAADACGKYPGAFWVR
jgi:hypothetical protein